MSPPEFFLLVQWTYFGDDLALQIHDRTYSTPGIPADRLILRCNLPVLLVG
jgi:hypothetical protein